MARTRTSKRWKLETLSLKSRNLLKLSLPGYGDGIRTEIPFFVLVGKKRRPRALMVAGVHGDEYESVAALQDLSKELDPKQLAGTVIIVPVANPQAFYAGTRRSPVDLGDLNRVFPGRPDGTISERLAHLLFTEIVLGSDGILSMHCWSKEATAISYVEYADEETSVGRKSFGAAAALGLEYLHPYKWHPGLLVAAATRCGIPSIEPEVGGMGRITAMGQRIYRGLVYRFLEHFKLLEPGEAAIEPACPNPKIIDHTDCLANSAGLFRARVSAGEAVERNTLLGTVHSLAGTRLEEIRAPRAGTVAILRTFSSVQPGDRMAQLFWEKTYSRKSEKPSEAESIAGRPVDFLKGLTGE